MQEHASDRDPTHTTPKYTVSQSLGV
jgi:hypothetical protein